MLNPSKELYEIAIDCIDEAYESKDVIKASDGTTEFIISEKMLQVKEKADWITTLAIAGTNEKLTFKNIKNFLKEWWKNIDLRAIRGIKKAGVDAMVEILKLADSPCFGIAQLRKNEKLLIVVHSKSGPTGIAFADRHRNNDNVHIVAFAPARSLRKKGIDRNFPNMTVFVDPDDIVHQLGFISFQQPICKTYKLPNNHFGKNLKDHGLKNFRKFIEDPSFKL